ncbi:MAG: NTP transferase domain-containing protein [Candidatus Eisenbacteria sp.]|nr:NTP transferase domain-containing protein [Candidatus Eisenbacteria bacterium]
MTLRSHAANGVLLAGGASTRMGRPKALLQIPGSGHFLIEDQLERLARAGCAHIAGVLGADAERIAGALDRSRSFAPETLPGRPQVLLCRNAAWEQGPFSSLQMGLRALAPSPRGAVVLPLDVPGVGGRVFERLLTAALAGVSARPSDTGAIAGRESDTDIEAGAGPDSGTDIEASAGPDSGTDVDTGDTLAGSAPDAVIPTFAGRGGHPIWIAPQTIAAILAAPPSARLDHLLRGLCCERLTVEDPRVRGNVNTQEDWERYCASLAG